MTELTDTYICVCIHVYVFVYLYTCIHVCVNIYIFINFINTMYVIRELKYNCKIYVLKSKDITLPTKVHIVKAMVFPVLMYKCES